MKWEDFSSSLFEKCKQRRVPYHASFELTPYCNFNCNMCYIHLNPEQAAAQGKLLTTDQWLDLTKQAKSLGVITLEVTGGEALTRSDFPVLYENFIKSGFLITLRTNGYLLSGDIVDLMKKYKPRAISITLYGSSDETYKKVCGISNGFSTVTHNIENLLKNGLTPKLAMTMTRDNQNDLSAVKSWAEKHRLNIRPFGRLFTPFKSTNRSIEELQVDYFSKEPEYDPNLDTIQREIPEYERYKSPFWMCRGYGGIFSISWNGRIKLCNGFEGLSKDALSTSLKEAYQNLYYDLDHIKRPERCRTCKIVDYCFACPKRLYSDSHDLEEACDSICRTAQILYKRDLKRKANEIETGVDLDMRKDNDCED